MSLYNYNDPYRIKSLPIRLEWDGWESNTFHLQRSGWEIAASQDLSSCGLEILLRNEKRKIYMRSQRISIDYFHIDSHSLSSIIIPIYQVGCNMVIQSIDRNFDNFKLIDAEPKYDIKPFTVETRNIEDFAIFSPALVKTNELIIPEESVDDLLEKIQKLQDPMLQKYYAEEAKKRKEAPKDQLIIAPASRMVAQIISLQNYRKAA